MKKLLLFCSLFIGLSSNAQVNFLNNTIMDGKGCFGEINKVIPLDIDNDGDFDMISSAESGLIGWHENLDGLGNFGPLHVIYGGYFGITSMYLADINNDGEMDIIISSKENGRIAWYENIGQGNFVEHELITDLTGANDVKAADIDGDGYLDIVANTNQGSIGWFKNTNGLGDFSTIYPISTGLAVITSIDVQDVDGDGDIDIVANSTQFNQFIRVGIYKNLNGLGNFGTFQLITSVSPEPNYSIVSTLLFEDLDNDGDYDIIFSANNQLLTLTNNGQGNFSTINTIFSSYIRDRIRAVNVTDMDYDGDLDIVMAMTTTTLDGYDKVMWYENDSTHSYTTSHIAQFFRKNDIRTFMIVDLDGDALHDMITGSRFGDVLVWYKDYTSLRALGKICFSPRRMQMVDLDNDGDLDFIMFAGLNKLVWYENIDGSGTAGLQKIITFKDGTPGYSTGDINGDGFIDIVIDQKWFKNDGLGNFTEMIFVTESANQSSNYSNYTVEDVDNDGYNDLFSITGVSENTSLISWYKNLDGLGNFGPRQVIKYFSSPHTTFVFADIDGDGDKDIIFSGGTLGILKNLDGVGTFSTTIQSIYSYPVGQIFCVDIDGDGDLDILAETITELGTTGGGWFKNPDGLGNFTSHPKLIYSDLTRGVFPADMDNDGDIDIVTSNTLLEDIMWAENTNGLGIFSQPKLLISNSETNSTNNIVDVDNDGKMDILFTTVHDSNSVKWFKNMGLSLNKITGTIKLDLNNNGCTATDNPMPNVKVLIQPEMGESYATFSSSNGYYQSYLQLPGAHTTSVASTLPSYFSVTPNSYETNFVGINNVQALDFCVTTTQTVNDLDVAIYPIIEARPGFINRYIVVYRNKGTTVQSGNVKLQFDATKIGFNGSFPLVTTQTSDDLTYNFTNLQPFETKIIRLSFQTFAPPIVNLGDVLGFTCAINPLDDDATPTDNIFQFNQTVVGSFDPNDINVLEGDSILLEQVNEYLHYVIRFQNTGTAGAINVTVTNDLDNNLDWDSLQIEGISHNNYISIRDGNQISFIFKNIYLPHILESEEGSQGFITYKIKPKSSSLVGDKFHNNAKIYFDYNAPIHTNTVSTEILNPLTVQEFEKNNVTLYPNPTSGKIYLSVNFEIKSIAVYSIYGQKIAAFDNAKEIDLSDYADGVYFIKIDDSFGKSISKKIVKK